MPSKIKHVLIDMDGVVANFVGAMIDAHNKPDPWATSIGHRGKYDLSELWEMSVSEFFAPCNNSPEFWEDLEPHDDGFHMMNHLNDNFPDLKLFFCSSPSACPSSHYGKMKWVKKYFPKMLNRTILTNHKYLLAKSDTILIDDSDKNVESFKKAGGVGIVFPRMWNSKFAIAHDSLKVMKMEIGRFVR